jgi:adenylosuccinate lyase
MLEAISPIDGRYSKQTESLQNYFSEKALIKYRIKVEVLYFNALCRLNLSQFSAISLDSLNDLTEWIQNIEDTEIQSVKDIEKTTNHDVKAVEYIVKAKMKSLGLDKYEEFIHFGLTSQDINNTAFPMMVQDALKNVMYPEFFQLTNKLQELVNEWADQPLLAHTHGQPASPTRLGKEIKVFFERINIQINQLTKLPISGKFGGATGNFNAHFSAYPEIDWVKFANQFLENDLKIYRQQTTTQIEHYDQLAALFQNLCRINTILIDFCRDIWTYISMEYFKQKTIAGEVGSSAMPHKVNPIDFENAEGNLGIANAIFHHLAEKLPISRLQRDLTDSTVLRNVGVPFAHSLIALKSIQKGLNKLVLNKIAIEHDLDNNWAVIAEGIQNILRREGYPKPYEALKDLTRGKTGINEADLKHFVENLNVDAAIKSELLQLSPHTYLGIKI